MRRSVILLVSVLTMTVMAAGLVSPQPPQASETRLLLFQALAAMGGTPPADSRATGTATLYVGGSEEVQNFKLLTRGLHEYREERLTADGPVSVTFSRSRAFANVGGKITRLSGENAINDYCPYFPLAGIVGDIANGDVAVEYIGTEIQAGKTHYRVRLWNTFATDEIRSEYGLSEYTTTEIWLDASTLLPAKLAYNVYAIDAPGEPIPVEIEYDSYQDFGGVLYPTRMTKYLNGTLFAEIAITNVQIDAGVTDADLGLD